MLFITNGELLNMDKLKNEDKLKIYRNYQLGTKYQNNVLFS